MNWIELSREESQRQFEEYCATGSISLQGEFVNLRDDLRRLFESDIDVMPEQAENASAPISLRLAESVSDVMPGQPLKA